MTDLPTPRQTATGQTWLLPLLVCSAAWLILDDLWDAGVLKAAALSLLCALVIVPVLALHGRDALSAWFASRAARLMVLSTVLAALGALEALDHASVTDRLLLFGLANVAAACGLLAARRKPEALANALQLCGLVVAAVCLAQATGIEQTLTTAPDEVVGLSGNTTRAGALLAMVLAAAVVSNLGRAASASSAWLQNITLVACSCAFVLTRARGARWALLVALIVMGAVAWWRHERNPGQACARVLVALLMGTALATLIGGSDALFAQKLDDQAAIFSGDDPTTGVRLSLAGTAWAMTVDHPAQGVGLGRFRQFAPPYRDPGEAARPGLEGSVTEAEHPHNEVLLAFAEGGFPAGIMLVLALLLTLGRGIKNSRGEQSSEQRVALAVFVTGLVLGLGQDAWTDPATAIPFFAAMGFLWMPHPEETRAWLPTSKAMGFGAVALGLGLGLSAWPRLDAQMSLRSFYQRTEKRGTITSEAYAALVHASHVGAGDPAMQRMLLDMAPRFMAQVREPTDKAQVVLDIEAAKQRLAILTQIEP
ncbi:MAG: O-antigen ligase [Pseudohongiellaceae bacterium]|jgi:O-antigen ligase